MKLVKLTPHPLPSGKTTFKNPSLIRVKSGREINNIDVKFKIGDVVRI